MHPKVRLGTFVYSNRQKIVACMLRKIVVSVLRKIVACVLRKIVACVLRKIVACVLRKIVASVLRKIVASVLRKSLVAYVPGHRAAVTCFQFTLVEVIVVTYSGIGLSSRGRSALKLGGQKRHSEQQR